MRLPVRITGMVGGLAALAVGPLLAIGHSGHLAPTASVVAPAPQVEAVTAGHIVYLPRRDAVVEMRIPEPTPPPTAAPTPVPSPTRAASMRPALAAAPALAAPAPAAPKTGTIESIIYAAATAHGVSYSWMLKIARCESTLNPRAYNPAGPYIGLFQFLPSTFRAHGGTDIYDPVQQANITADMLAHGQARAWGCA